MGRAQAMIDMCKQCMGIESGENFSVVIGECTANDDRDSERYCPLWVWRPGAVRQKKTRNVSEETRERHRERMKKLHAEGRFKKGKKEPKNESKKESR